MTTNEMLTLARELVAKHLDREVPVKLGRGTRTLGHYKVRMQYGKVIAEEIVLSKYLAEVSREEIVDTILHEIAHAIAGVDADHGPKWKAAARKVGARPVRTYQGSEFSKVAERAAAWFAHCNCGKYQNLPVYRRGRHWREGNYKCGKCNASLFLTKHKIEGKIIGVKNYVDKGFASC